MLCKNLMIASYWDDGIGDPV